jgi:uncharacterized protein (TIGR02147 family)
MRGYMLENHPQKLPQHFSNFLLNEYDTRKLKNTSYSLRAFARDIEISSGKLSDILGKKVGISKSTALKISKKLNLSEEDENLFLGLVEVGLERKSYNFDSKYLVLGDDYFQILTNWHYFALVELIALDCFQNNVTWIAKRLGISESIVPEAIERLKRVKLVQEIDNTLQQTYDYYVSPSGTPSDNAKKFHTQILSKAQEALISQEIEERDFTSGFLRARKSDLPYIAKRIKEFRRELAKEIEAGEGHDSVYAFSIQFFRGDSETA